MDESVYPSSSETDSEQLQFRGQNAAECKSFIAALLKLGFARGKQRDDQWMADSAATRMADDALVWWNTLDEETQGSWKLLSQAMLSEYRPMFYGGSGEEAEKFIRAIHDKAIGEGKGKDNEWIVTYAESCFAGEALRWYAYLGSDTQGDWKKLQQALLIQYPRGGPAINLVPSPPAAVSVSPAPKPRRGRIKISSSSSSTTHYVSKNLTSNNRVASTSSIADALEFEWNISSDGLQTLSIPDSQILGYDLLAIKWNSDDASQTNRYLWFCVVDSKTNSTSLSSCTGTLLTNDWRISVDDGRNDGAMTVSVLAGKVKLCSRWQESANGIWFSDEKNYSGYPGEYFFEPI